MTKRRVLLRGAVAAALAALLSGCGGYNWLQWGGGPAHSGQNLGERSITLGNVSTLHRLFVANLPVGADGAPAYLSNVSTPSGSHDALFVESELGDLVALDAHSGAQLWKTTFSASTCRINNTQGPCYTTSSPAIDPNGRFVYAYGLDGKVHKVAIGTGAEVVDAHWPELSTLKGFDEKGSSALSTATARDGTSYLYSTHSGYPGDAGDYQGHVTAINLATGAQRVFNTLCSNLAVHFANRTAPDCPETQSGVWARGGVVYSAATDRIYLVTGNAAFSPASHHWGDTVLALNPDGSGNASGDPVDTYTPANFAQLNSQDLDLGSTAPAILPVTDTRKVRNLAVQGGKDQILRLLDLDNLSGHGGPGFTGGEIGAPIPVPQAGQVLTTPTVWTNPADGSTWVFVVNNIGASALQVVYDASGNPSLSLKWKTASAGKTATIANGVLFYGNGNHIDAYNPTTGAVVWTDTSLTPIHWQSPIVANGVLYIEDGGGHVYAYGL